MILKRIPKDKISPQSVSFLHGYLWYHVACSVAITIVNQGAYHDITEDTPYRDLARALWSVFREHSLENGMHFKLWII